MLEQIQTDRYQKKWEKARLQAAKYLLDENDQMKRPQIDTWVAVDDLGLTVHEFRLLYCIARHENWGSRPKKFIKGCYASTETLSKITGISRNKVFEVLLILREAKIIERISPENGQPLSEQDEKQKKGRVKQTKGSGKLLKFYGWTYEYRIKAITDWVTPLELIEIRNSVLENQSKSKKISSN